jgi:glycosyltransferase involved in cell wall biosynthesis
MMKISIIVPAYNEERLLPAALSHIKESSRVLSDRGWEIELIVCDNNSTDRTVEVAREKGAIMVFEPVNQISRARNRGAAVASGDWLWFIDADSFPSAHLFRRTAEEIETGLLLAIGTTLEFDDVPWVVRAIAGVWKLWSRLLSHMAGSFVVVETRAFRAIDGFSTEFFAGEEVDLSIRLKRWGRRQNPRRRVKVLSDAPLLTSGRKAHLYSTAETLRFLLRAMFAPLRTMRRKEDCAIWYDGRR